MSTTTIPPRTNLRSSDFQLTGSDIAFLSEGYEIGFSDFPSAEYSAVSQMLDGWWGRTLLRSMPLALLRRKLRRAIFGEAPDKRTEKKWQREIDQLIADAVISGEVELVRGDGRR